MRIGKLDQNKRKDILRSKTFTYEMFTHTIFITVAMVIGCKMIQLLVKSLAVFNIEFIS